MSAMRSGPSAAVRWSVTGGKHTLCPRRLGKPRQSAYNSAQQRGAIPERPAALPPRHPAAVRWRLMRRAIGSLTLLSILLLAIAPAVLAARPSTGFTGSWVAIDPLDGSNLSADISGDTTTQIVYTDDNATNACEGSSTAVFTSLLIGNVDGDEMFT